MLVISGLKCRERSPTARFPADGAGWWRRRTVSIRRVTPSPPRLRKVLLVGASPDEDDTVRADRELRELRAAARLGHLQVTAVLAAQVSDLRALLRERPDVLHLSTHGDGESLYFESSFGERQRVPVAEVIATLARYRNEDDLKLTGLVMASCR